MLRVARTSAVKARTAATVQIRDLIITAPQPLRDQLAKHKTLPAKARACVRFRVPAENLTDSTHAAKFALRSLARRIADLDQEIKALDRQLDQLVATAAPRTIQLLGSRPGTPASYSSPPARTSIASTATARSPCLRRQPNPGILRKTSRNRLNHGGDRQANRALYLIAVCRLSCCPRTRDYATRRAREGKSQREIIRCLKRYIAREVYNTLRADLADLATHQPQPRTVTTILCGSPGIGITRKRT